MDYHKMNQIHMAALQGAVIDLVRKDTDYHLDVDMREVKRLVNKYIDHAIALVEANPDMMIIPAEQVREACKTKEDN